jgi:hypothetical protein
MLPPFRPVLTGLGKASERSTDVTIDEHARGEKVELELDAFVAKRDAERRRIEGVRTAEAIWAQSEREYFARLDEERRLARLTYHRGQVSRLSNTLGDLVAYHRGEAEKLMKDHERKAS